MISDRVVAPETQLLPQRPQGLSSRAGFGWVLVLLPLAWLWFRLLNNLRVEWTTNPQYSYGWLVLLICIGLLARRWSGKNEGMVEPRDREAKGRGLWVAAFALLALLYLPTRLVEGATPEWRPIEWSLGVVTIGLTLCAIYLGKGRHWLKQVAFPICLVFVAIPWPTLFETPLIQWLTRLNSAAVVEVLGVLGVPAVQHGNVIEVGTGVVGIDDACSGIRSFQSSLMISLVLGEFYFLSVLRRLLLVPAAFILALLFNVCRTSILTLAAAKQGVAAIARYHDEAGISILIACFLVTWAVAFLLRGSKARVQGPKPAELPLTPALSPSDGERGKEGGRNRVAEYGLWGPALGLLGWLVLVEIGVEAWYRSRESQLATGPAWSVQFPTGNPTFTELPIAPATAGLLRFDEGKQGGWRESDGTEWSGFYFNWRPGRVAGYLAKRHTPDICMPAAGRKIISGPDLMVLKIHGVELPMRRYVFESGGRLLYVFQCRWEAGADRLAYVTEESARYNLVRGIWAGRGKRGQKVLEVIGSGLGDDEQAKEALVRQLEKLIKVEKQANEAKGAATPSRG